MTDYVAVPFETDPDDLLTTIFDYIQARIAGWEPNEGNLEVILSEAFAEVMAEIRDLASDMPTTLFRYFGTNIANLPPIEATQATCVMTWTALDNAGYTIPADTIVTLTGLDGNPVAFTVDVDTDIVSPATTVDVGMTAIQAGSSGTGLGGTASLVDALDFVDTVVVIGTTAGGLDAEEDSIYLSRLVDELRLQSPRPILPNDFAVMAATIEGVARATAIDNYDADLALSNVEGAITVALVDVDGNTVTTLARNAVDTLLAGTKRVLNLAVFLVDPDYNTIDVSYSVSALPDYDLADVQTRVDAAVSDYLSASHWGLTPGVGERPAWINTTVVRRLELAKVILNVDGVAYFNSSSTPELCLSGGVLDTLDVTLTGIAPLTLPGVISGTVT
jgi:hypothetical protein